MFGILVEMVDGGLTANDIWQARQMAAKNDPWNQPIADMCADVSIHFAPVNFETRQATPWLADFSCIGTNPDVLVNLGEFSAMISDSFSIEVFSDEKSNEVYRKYLLHFRKLPNTEFTDLIVKTPGIGVFTATAKDVNQVAGLMMRLFFVPHDVEIVGGSVILQINGELRKYFVILPQKAYPRPKGMPANDNGFGLTIFATNSPLVLVPK
jgi:hypothetical protein